jgi:hypothetical protein
MAHVPRPFTLRVRCAVNGRDTVRINAPVVVIVCYHGDNDRIPLVIRSHIRGGLRAQMKCRVPATSKLLFPVSGVV